MAKRLRPKKVSPGQVRVYWGRVDGDYPDVVFHWGDGCKRDAAYVQYMLGTERMRMGRAEEGRYAFDPSFLEGLKARGFDITTLEFSIRKSASPA